MALYTYMAMAPGERAKEVSIEADSRREAEQKLRSLKLAPVRFTGEVDTARTGGTFFHGSRIDVLDFTDQLSPLLNSAIPLERAIGIIAEGVEEPEQKQFVLALRQGLHEGKKFSELVRGYGALFPGYYANLIETGEETGSMPEVVEELRRFMAESRELKDFIVTSSIYPAVVLAITLLVTILMFTVFVPRFAKVFADMGRELPGSMRFLMGLSDIFLYGIILVPAGVWLIQRLLLWRLGRRRLDELKARILLRLPVIGALDIDLEMGKFTRTLAILVSNHVDIIRTVRIGVKVIQNPVIRASFGDLEAKLKSGRKLSAALQDNPFVPAGLPAKLRVGEESGSSGAMLLKSAGYLEAGTRRRIKRILSMFEPLVIVFLALVVMTVVLAIFMAIMELNSIEG